jgi:retinol dehydrogenase-14
MSERISIVTGANSGIGKVTARELARRGDTVVMICRSSQRGEQARQELITATGNERIDLIQADFASLDHVRRAATTFKQRYQRLDVLVNNAGLLINKRMLSADGYEATFAINHLAPFLLTHLLLDTIKASAPARIINLSSGAHFAANLRLNDLQAERGYNAFIAYSNSKLCNVLFSYELARRLAGTGVTVNAVHPGGVATNFARGNESGGLLNMLFGLARPFLRTPEQGAETSIYLATSPEVEGVTGKYFADSRPQTSSGVSRDSDIQRRLWAISEELTGIREEVAVG